MGSFEEFLKTGRLGPLAIGMTKDAVRELLGAPSDTSVSNRPEIWKYGPIELAFYRIEGNTFPVVVSIIFHFDDSNCALPASLALEGWMPTCEITYQEFRSHLDRLGLSVFGDVESGPSRHLVLGLAMRVTFEEGRLASVGVTYGREPEIQQMSISVRKDDLRSIRREAKARGISASALCSLWVREQVAVSNKQEA